MYSFPGAYQGGNQGGGGGGKKKKKKGGKGRGGGGGGGKAAAAQVKHILERANGDLAHVLYDVDELLRHQRGGRLDMGSEALRELLVTVVRSGAVEAAGALAKAHRGGPDGDTPFTPVDALHILEAMPQQFNTDPMQGAAFVDVVAAMTQFGGDDALQAYFRTRCRFSVLEFLSEAKQVMDDIRGKPLESLMRQGKAVPNLAFQGPGMKSGELSFRSGGGGGGGESGFRGIVPGDFVVLTPSDNSRPEEMSVEKSGMPTILKALDKSGYTILHSKSWILY